ncbi:hypothetical protein [Chryseobacterium koreense]
MKAEGAFSPALNGNISFEALQEFCKTFNFARSTIQKFVRPFDCAQGRS